MQPPIRNSPYCGFCVLFWKPHIYPRQTSYVYCPNQPTNRVKAATADFDPEVAIRELQAILNWDNKYKSMGAFIGFEVSSVYEVFCYQRTSMFYLFHLEK